MDESKKINRDQLLKLGGIGAAGAVAALLADAAPADASTPIGLDYTSTEPPGYTAAGYHAKTVTALPVYRVLVTADDPSNAHVPPDFLYTIKKPHVHAQWYDGHKEDEDRAFLMYVAIWLKKTP